MTPVVVDASVAVKWYLDEPYAAQAQRVLDSDAPLHAPDLVHLEVDSVLCKRVRRGEITSERADAVRHTFRQVPILLHPFGVLLDPAYALARAGKCSVYDGLYVVLAELLQARMLTADERLCRSLAGTPLAKHLLWIGDLRADEQTPLEPSP